MSLLSIIIVFITYTILFALKPEFKPFAGKLKDTIVKDFGSFGSIDKFKKELKKSALNLSTSGWAWLVSNPE